MINYVYIHCKILLICHLMYVFKLTDRRFASPNQDINNSQFGTSIMDIVLSIRCFFLTHISIYTYLNYYFRIR